MAEPALLPGDTTDSVKAQVDRLRHANTVIMHELSKVGAGVDFVVGMVNTYFETMVALEIITEDQWLDMQLTWEQRFNKQLTQMQAQVRDTIERQQVRQRLVIPGRG
jgi:hypothetical protein